MHSIKIQGNHPAWAWQDPAQDAGPGKTPHPPPTKPPPIFPKVKPPPMFPVKPRQPVGPPPAKLAAAGAAAAARGRYEARSTAASTSANDYSAGGAPNRLLPFKGPPPRPNKMPGCAALETKTKSGWPPVPAKAPACNQTAAKKPSKGKKHLSTPYISSAASHACICNHYIYIYIYLHVCNDISIYEQEATS